MPRPKPLQDPAVLARLAQLGAPSDTLWLLGMAIGLSFTLIAAYFFPYPADISGKFWAYAGLLLRAWLYLWAGEAQRDQGGLVLQRLLLMGLVAGSFELLVDWVLIHGVRSGRLVYLTGNDVVLLGSPIWMPLAWACVITELGYPALRLFSLLRRRWGLFRSGVVATAVVAASAGVTVGFYEYFAYLAGWWKYDPARAMIGQFCALYVPLGEAIMFLPILPLAAHALRGDEHDRSSVLESGLAFGIAIALGYGIAYLALES